MCESMSIFLFYVCFILLTTNNIYFLLPLISEIVNPFGRKGLCLLISITGFDQRKAVP